MGSREERQTKSEKCGRLYLCDLNQGCLSQDLAQACRIPSCYISVLECPIYAQFHQK